MNFDALRQKILEKAIRGELVPQLESEPEVSQIGEAPEAVPFAIPEKWKWVPASYVQTLVRGITFPASAKTKTQASNSICCLTTGSVQEKYANKADVFVGQSFLKNSRQILQMGDVVISSANSKELVGKSIFWQNNSGIQKTFGGFLTVARVKDNQTVLSGYLFLVYRYMFKTGYFANLSTQTTNIANLSNKLLNSLVFPIAPLAEQKRIIKQVNQLFEQIDCAEKAYNELSGPLSERFRQLCLEKAIQGKLVPQLESEPEVEQIGEAPEDVPFAIPEKWKWVLFSDAVKVISSRPFQIKAKEVLEQGLYPVISQSKEQIDGYSNDDKKLIPDSELPIIIFGDHTRTLKYVDFRFVVGADGTKLLHVKTSSIDPKYFYIALQSMIEQTRQRGYSRHFQFLKVLHIPIPPIEEQRRIVAKLNELLDCIRELKIARESPSIARP